MAYQIGTREMPGDGLRRTARGEVADALAQIESDAHPEVVLHAVRKGLKKLSALLRLAHKKSAGRSEKQLAALIQITSRRIARLRDMQVQMRALQKIEKKCRAAPAAVLCRSMQTQLARRVSKTNTARLRRETAMQLRKAATLIKKWPPEEPSWPALWRAWGRTREKSLRQMKRALENPGDESLHKWRKRAKTWWYQTRLLRPHSEKKLGKLCRDLETLTEWLGDDHDLALVGQTVEKINSTAKAPFLTLLRNERARLQKKAAKLGLKLAQ